MNYLITANNSDLVFRLNLNYNTLYFKLRTILGDEKCPFANIKLKSKETSWFAPDDGLVYKQLNNAGTEEQKKIKEILAATISDARAMLSTHKDLLPYIDGIFDIPDEKYIFYTDAPSSKILLTAWGCRTAHISQTSSGTLAQYISQGKPNAVQEVVVKAIDALGNPLSVPLMCDYNGEHFQIELDSSGEKNMGMFQLGDLFYITNLKTDEKRMFTVSQGCRTYVFQVSDSTPVIDDINKVSMGQTIRNGSHTTVKSDEKPKQNVVIKLMNMKGNILPSEAIRLNVYGEFPVKYSDQSGLVKVGEMSVGDTFSVVLASDSTSQVKNYVVEPGKEIYEFYCQKTRKVSPILSIEDKDGVPVSDFDVRVLISGRETINNSGSEGLIFLQEIPEGSKIVVMEKGNLSHSEEFIAKDGEDVLHFVLENGDGKVLNITIVDKKGKPVTGCDVEALLGDEYCMQKTGKNGVVSYPVHLLKDSTSVPVKCSALDLKTCESVIELEPGKMDYVLAVNRKPHITINKGILTVLGCLLVLFGGYKLYDLIHSPSINSLSKGVVLVRTVYRQYADLKDKSGHVIMTYYFNFTDEQFQPLPGSGYHFDVNKSTLACTGTGFFISPKGKIVTNKHVASPDLPSLDQLIECMSSIYDIYRRNGTANLSKDEYQTYLSLDAYVRNVNDYKVELGQEVVDVSVAYYKSIIESDDDLYSLLNENFHSCIVEKSGNSWQKDDLSIIQVKNMESLPKDVHVFKVPAKDPISDNERGMDIRVLGYNRGLLFANGKEGISPQVTKGVISSIRNEYDISYDVFTEPGSSGSPVIDNRGHLIAVNHAGYAFNLGVRLIHLINLLKGENSNKQ